MGEVVVENIFMEALSDMAAVSSNGINHSERFFDMMLSDARLSDLDESRVLVKIRSLTSERIEELNSERREILRKLESIESFNPGNLEEAIKNEQHRALAKSEKDFFIKLYAIFMTIIMLAMNFFVIKTVIFVSAQLLMILFVFLVTCAVFRRKSRLITEKEQARKKVESLYRKIDKIGINILNLEKLRILACKQISERGYDSS